MWKLYNIDDAHTHLSLYWSSFDMMSKFKVETLKHEEPRNVALNC